jgi:hypothetical protein
MNSDVLMQQLQIVSTERLVLLRAVCELGLAHIEGMEYGIVDPARLKWFPAEAGAVIAIRIGELNVGFPIGEQGRQMVFHDAPVYPCEGGITMESRACMTALMQLVAMLKRRRLVEMMHLAANQPMGES